MDALNSYFRDYLEIDKKKKKKKKTPLQFRYPFSLAIDTHCLLGQFPGISDTLFFGYNTKV